MVQLPINVTAWKMQGVKDKLETVLIYNLLQNNTLVFENSVKINKSYENIISFQLNCLPYVTFLLCYITPDNSPYYDKAIIGQIHSILNEDIDNVYILFGDLNARIGTTFISTKG